MEPSRGSGEGRWEKRPWGWLLIDLLVCAVRSEVFNSSPSCWAGAATGGE